MIIAFLTIETPSLKKGAPVRIYNLIKQAVSSGSIVDLITLVDVGEDAESLKRELGVRKIVAIPKTKSPAFRRFFDVFFHRIPPYFSDYRSSSLDQAVIEYANETRPDIIQIELLHTYDAISSSVPFLKRLGAKIILDEHNIEYKAFWESISTFSFLKNLLGRYIAPKLLTIESEASQEVDHIFICSEIDKSFFVKKINESKLTLVPNGVNCDLFKIQPLVSENTIIFTGGMYYPPNDDALRFYFSSIHPLVKSEIPDIKIILLGGELNPWLKKISESDQTIIAPGLVPDVRSYIGKARICISPIRKGSGTSLKLLEYMGSGKPIVTTKMGARGIDCRNEKEALVADDPQEFANDIVRLLRDDKLAVNLGATARKTVENLYNWEIIGRKMTEQYGRLVTKKT